MKKMFLASLALTIFAASITLFQMSSCTKSVSQEKQGSKSFNQCSTSIMGLWVGTYSVDGQGGQQYFSIIIKPDGTMINDSYDGPQQHLGVGTWTLDGNTLTCISTCVYGYPGNVGIVEQFTASFDSTTGLISSGVWQNYPDPTGTGTFEITKVY